jgi:PAS domain S-box-containing protein
MSVGFLRVPLGLLVQRFVRSPLALGAAAVTWLLLLALVIMAERSAVQSAVMRKSFDEPSAVWLLHVTAIDEGLDDIAALAVGGRTALAERSKEEIGGVERTMFREIAQLEEMAGRELIDPMNLQMLRHRVTRVVQESHKLVELDPASTEEDRRTRVLVLGQVVANAKTRLRDATERRSNWLGQHRGAEAALAFSHWFTQVPYWMCGISIVLVVGWVAWSERTARALTFEGAKKDLRADLAEQSPVPILALSTEGKILWGNAAALRLLGRPAIEVLDHSLVEFSRDAEQARSVVTRLSEAQTHSPLPFDFVDSQGRTIPTMLAATVRFDARADYLRVVITDISRNVAVENAYRASEHKLRMVIENLPSGVFLTDMEGNCEFTNDTWCRLAGMSRERARGRGWADALHPEDRERVFAEWKQATETGSDFRGEYRFLTPTGHQHWINGHAVPIRNEAGQVVQYLGNVIDVTAMKNVEELLQEQKRRLDAILETAIDGIVVLDERGIIESANPALQRLFGYSESELIGRNVNMLMGTPHREAHDGYLQRFLINGPNPELGERREVEGVDRNGRRFPLELSVSVTRDAGQIRFTGILHDISDRTRVVEQLRASEERLELAVTGSSDVIWDIDIDSGRSYFSPRLATVLGMDPADVHPTATWFESRIHPADLRKHQETLAAHLSQDRPYQLDLRVRTEAGDYRWFLARGKAVRDESGRAVRIAGSWTDITHHKRQEAAIVRYAEEVEEARQRIEQQTDQLLRQSEELAHANREAEAAAVAKGQFLANMSHEIRTPLNAVLGMTDLVLDGELEPEQRELLQSVKSSGEHLLGIVNDILDFSKIEAGKLLISEEPFDLKQIVDETLTLLRSSARTKGLDLDLAFEPHTPRRVVGDADRLRQVLFNLVGNAIKFTTRGGVTVSVLPPIDPADADLIHFVVADTGIGIPADKLQAIFNPFEQADVSTTRRFGGTGLGLAIVRTIVNQLGGRVWVESAEGRGTRFEFLVRLPERPADDESAGRNENEAARMVAASPVRVVRNDVPPLRVLVAEDNAINRKIISEMLSRLGHLVTLVENGGEAIAAGKAGVHDLILMDLQMPGIDGTEAIRAIREDEFCRNSPAIPIIVLSASTLETDRERCRLSGATGYLTKPVNHDDLSRELDRVDKIIDERQTRTRELSEALLYRTDGDAEMGVELCDIYFESAQSLADGLVLAFEANDLVEVRRLAHQLRGSTVTFGQGALVTRLSEIEYDGDNMDPREYRERTSSVPGLTRELLRDLCLVRTELALRTASDPAGNGDAGQEFTEEMAISAGWPDDLTGNNDFGQTVNGAVTNNDGEC